MTIKLALLKSGEDVIADIAEMVVEEKVVGYVFEKPGVVKLIGDPIKEGKNKSPYKIQITPWMPLSRDQKIPVVADWVITITEPIDQLKEMYEKGTKKNGNQEPEVVSTGEQSDDSESD
tara:strand:+ start:60 stop:416 length:357 start_codon:yes stop_codon:yes gene_type:complete